MMKYGNFVEVYNNTGSYVSVYVGQLLETGLHTKAPSLSIYNLVC